MGMNQRKLSYLTCDTHHVPEKMLGLTKLSTFFYVILRPPSMDAALEILEAQATDSANVAVTRMGLHTTHRRQQPGDGKKHLHLGANMGIQKLVYHCLLSFAQ